MPLVKQLQAQASSVLRHRADSLRALLRRGPGHLAMVLRAVQEWMEEHEYESVEQLKGSISQRNATDSAAFLRSNYMRVLDSYQPPSGVLW